MFEEIDNEEVTGISKYASSLTDKLPRGYLSVSQITQFMKCGRAYEFRYLQDVPIPRNSFTAQGSALHKAAEKMHLSMMDNAGAPPLSYVESAYEDAHTEYFVNDPELVIMEEDVDAGRVKDVGIEMIRLYHRGASGQLIDPDTKLPMRPLYPIAAERVVRTMLKPLEGEEVPFMAVIDIEEPTNVRDLKTKRKKGSQADADNSLQLSLYASITQKPDVHIDQLIKPTKTMGPRYIRVASHRTQEEMLHAVEIAASVATDIAKGRFPLTMPDNWWCTANWCPYWGLCRGRKR